MSRQIPMAPCLALLRSFDPDNQTPQQTIATAAGEVEGSINEQTMADLNNGQFAALIDFVIWHGIDIFEASVLFDWMENGNLTLPPGELRTYGARGKAEADVWNTGNGG